MKIIEVTERSPLLIQPLLEIWEKSVNATHFLSDSEIAIIKEYVLQASKEIPHLLVLETELMEEHWKCCTYRLRKEEKVLEKS